MARSGRQTDRYDAEHIGLNRSYAVYSGTYT